MPDPAPLETGNVLRHAGTPDAREVAYAMRMLAPADEPAVVAFQDRIYALLPDKDIYAHYAPEEIRACLTGRGSGIGTYADGEMIAFRMNYYPAADDPENLGPDAHIPQSEYDSVAHFERVMVDPAFRGNRLQLRMARRALPLFERDGKIHLCATVSPWNAPSGKNMMHVGLRIKALKKKYGGKWRWVLHRDCRAPAPGEPAGKRALAPTDLEPQIEALQQGFVGYAIEGRADQTRVLYGQWPPA